MSKLQEPEIHFKNKVVFVQRCYRHTLLRFFSWGFVGMDCDLCNFFYFFSQKINQIKLIPDVLELLENHKNTLNDRIGVIDPVLGVFFLLQQEESCILIITQSRSTLTYKT